MDYLFAFNNQTSLGTKPIPKVTKPLSRSARYDGQLGPDDDRQTCPKKNIRIGTINVVSLEKDARIQEITRIMTERNIPIMGLSEVRKKGTGSKVLEKGYKMWWSGKDKKRNGVAIIVAKQLADKVLNVDNVSDRIIKLKIMMEGNILDVVQVYAPQIGCEAEEKEEFITKLEDTVTSNKSVIMGDFNARVGNDRRGYETVLGGHGEDHRNEEGEVLLDTCLRNKWIIGNGWYKKRDSHKFTRYSWNLEQKSIIDYIIITEEIRRCLTEVKVIPSINLDGDHRLLVGTLKKFRKGTCGGKRQAKIKCWKLKDRETQEIYREKIKTQLPKDEGKDIEEEWKRFKQALVKAAEETCGRTSAKVRDKETPWWNERIAEAVKRKNNAWREWFKNRTEHNRDKWKRLSRAARKMIALAKKMSWEKFTKEIEENFKNDKKILYRLLGNRRKQKENTSKVINKEGNPVWEEEEVLKVWKEYFQKLYEGQNEINTRDEIEEDESNNTITEETETDLQMLDVENAVLEMKNGKAPGIDDVTVEMIKAAGPIGTHKGRSRRSDHGFSSNFVPL